MKIKITIVLIGLAMNAAAQKLLPTTPSIIASNDSLIHKLRATGFPPYTVYPQSEDALMSGARFSSVSARYFSFIAAGQDVTAPAVNNFSVDLLDAKFDIKGAVAIRNKKDKIISLINLNVSGDKEGNSATLFEDKKTGGKFEGELKFSFGPWKRFVYSRQEKERIWKLIRESDKKYYTEYLRQIHCTPVKKEDCDTLFKDAFLMSLSDPDATLAIKLKAITDSAETEQARIFNSAQWLRVQMLWVTLKGKAGGEKVYSVTQTLNYINDSVEKNNLMTGYWGLEGNYYLNWHRGLVVYANLGIGWERSNNILELDKISVTESLSMKDTTITNPNNSRKRDYSTKYDAFNGEIKTVDNILEYVNIYALLGKQQFFGCHVGLEYRSNTTIPNNTALTLGILTNASKKGDAKSTVSIEAFIKFNQINKTTVIDFENEHKTQIGLTFNVPIPSLPKN